MALAYDASGASNLEAQVLETVREIVQAEDTWVAAGLALDPPVTRARRFTLTPNLQAGILTINGTLPITFADAADGFSVTATEYIL